MSRVVERGTARTSGTTDFEQLTETSGFIRRVTRGSAGRYTVYFEPFTGVSNVTLSDSDVVTVRAEGILNVGISVVRNLPPVLNAVGVQVTTVDEDPEDADAALVIGVAGPDIG